jgi:hypothetical protein
VTHSEPLVTALHKTAGSDLRTIELVKEFGQTHVAGQDPLKEPPWHWPKR